MPTCHLLIGPPGCGKSTWTARNANGAMIFSSDDAIEEMAREAGETYGEAFLRASMPDIFADISDRIIQAVAEDRDIIIDQTNCTYGDRNRFRHLIPARYERIGVVFEFDRDEIIQRVLDREEKTGKHVPLWVVEDKINNYKAPLPGEFDSVIAVRLQSAP